jgi:hypothetical protein
MENPPDAATAPAPVAEDAGGDAAASQPVTVDAQAEAQVAAQPDDAVPTEAPAQQASEPEATASDSPAQSAPVSTTGPQPDRAPPQVPAPAAAPVKSLATPLALIAVCLSAVALAAPVLRGPVSGILGPEISQSIFGPDTVGRLNSAENRVANLEARMAEADSTLRRTSETVGRLGGDVPSLLGRMDVLERGTKSLVDDVASLKESRGVMQTDQATTPTDLGPRVVGLEDRLAQMSQQLDGIAGLVREADPQGVAKLTASLANIQDLLGRLAGDVDGLKGSVQGLDDQAESLSTRIDARDERNSTDEALLLGALRLEAVVRRKVPFGAELALVRGLGALDSNFGSALDTLAPYSDTGVATVSDLREDLRKAVPHILAAGVPEGATWTERTLDTLAGLVAMRRVPGAVEGDSPDAILARAEAKMATLDLTAAVAEVETLSPPHAGAAAAWLAAARERLAVDAAVNRLVDQALKRLTAPVAN